VRARIGALAAMPEAWAERARRWLGLTADVPGPDAVERYFVFQTLVGAWEVGPDRLSEYMEKALREAKRTSSWIEPDTAHEQAVQAFCRGLYEHDAFRGDFEPFAAEVARAGERAALGQLLLKLTVPGVPDIYQGDELLSLALVDPDNRRPVDWERRRGLLAEVRRGAAPTAETRKLWLIVRALTLRARHAAAFGGAYRPLEAGQDACAFVRGGRVLAAVAIRGDADLVDVPSGVWRDVLAGGERHLGGAIELAELTGDLGIALLERVDT
jgi:(1->4)-alpha-D-glucan 1-alpha-D-glucosylmutase